MKTPIFYTLMLLSLFVTQRINAQQENIKGLINQKKEGHIIRPVVVTPTDELIKSLKVPAGFKVEVFAKNLGKPRMLLVMPNGNVYVTNRQAGTVTLLKDANNDGKADMEKIVAQKDQMHGIAKKGNDLYLVTVKELYKAGINNDGSLDSLVMIAGNLPDGGQHGNRTIHFGPDSLLYISVGSTCNSCDETNNRNATMLQVNLQDSTQKIFAKGLRNTIGFAWHPQTKALWGFDHGIDWLGDFDQREELNQIKEGGDYGWPYVYGNYEFDKHHDPKGATHVEYAKHTIAPEMLYTAHAAPMDLLFYTSHQFPTDYSGDAFATMHGSWNRKPPSGYNIVRVRFNNGKVQRIEDFLTGFLFAEGTKIFGRPVGLAQYTDGSLLVADDENGMIYKISFENSVTKQ